MEGAEAHTPVLLEVVDEEVLATEVRVLAELDHAEPVQELVALLERGDVECLNRVPALQDWVQSVISRVWKAESAGNFIE